MGRVEINRKGEEINKFYVNAGGSLDAVIDRKREKNWRIVPEYIWKKVCAT